MKEKIYATMRLHSVPKSMKSESYRLSKSFVLAMKLTWILSFLFAFHLFAENGFSQKVSIQVREANLVNVLKQIQEQSGYDFLLSTHYADMSKPVTVNAKNADLKRVLSEVFKNQPFDYVISEKIITVKPKSLEAMKSDVKFTENLTSVRKVELAQMTATGIVVDEASRPLPGVLVAVQGTKTSGTTNAQGAFSIAVPNANSNIEFTLLGYQTVVRRVSESSMRIVLKASEFEVEEVVATGFRNIDKSKFVGSVSTVDKKNIDRSGAIDVSRMLQGAAAGVSVQNTSGTFGATPKIRIRGNSSISANQEPLYVLNGVPITSPSNVAVNQLYSGDPASVLGSAIAGLNAQDIEDIQILKDGAATALYGTRAANGVISITTKKGSYNSKNINFSTALSLGVKPNVADFNLMNSNQEMQLYKEMYDRGYLSNANWPNFTGAFTETYKQLAMRTLTLDQAYAELNRSAKANTDWFDVLFRNNLVQEHSLSFSGGGDKHTYYVSGSFADDDGQAIGFGMNRNTMDMRTVFNITPKFDLDVNLNWVGRTQSTPGTNESSALSASNFFEVTRSFEINPFNYAMQASRAMYPYNADGTYKYYTENLAPFNIIEELNENFNDVKTQEVRFILRPSYQILKNLRFDGTYALRRNINRISQTVTERSNMANAYRVDYNDVLRSQNSLLYLDPNNPNGYRETILPEGGFLTVWNSWQSFYNVRNQLSFTENFGDHRLYVMGGMEIEENLVEREYNKATGYLYYGGRIISPSRLAMIRAVNVDDRTFIESFQRRRTLGYYANIQYTFNNKYNLDLIGRSDGNNMFGRMTRTKFLPNYGVGFAWNAEREKFFEKINTQGNIDYLKIRVSHALRGNSFETSPMRNATIVNLIRLDGVNSTRGINVSSPELYQLAWEKDYTTNVAFDLSLYNRLTLTAEYYQRKNTDLVIPFDISQEEGFAAKSINFGNMTNKGVDVTLGFRDILNKETFRWDATAIFGYVQNRLTGGEVQSSLLTQITNPGGYRLQGKPLEGLYGYNFAGLDSQGQPLFYDEDGARNGLVSQERDRTLVSYLGSRQPLGTGSLANSFQYKGLELRVFLTFAYGHKIFTQPVSSRVYNDSGSKSGDLNYRWQTIGDENYTNIPGLISTIQRTYLSTISNVDDVAYNRSDFRAANASNLRISEVLLAYDLGKSISNRWGVVKNARLMLSANNIYYWASGRLRGVDPDLYINGGTTLPNPRSYSLRFIVGF